MSDFLYFNIKGNSMFPTYQDGDQVCLKRVISNEKVEVNDIVVFMHPLKKDLKVIKRVAHIKNKKVDRNRPLRAVHQNTQKQNSLSRYLLPPEAPCHSYLQENLCS